MCLLTHTHTHTQGPAATNCGTQLSRRVQPGPAWCCVVSSVPPEAAKKLHSLRRGRGMLRKMHVDGSLLYYPQEGLRRKRVVRAPLAALVHAEGYNANVNLVSWLQTQQQHSSSSWWWTEDKMASMDWIGCVGRRRDTESPTH